MSTYVGSLDSTYVSIINNLMTIESQSLDQMEARRDSITLQRNTYSDSRSKLDALQDSLQTLISTDAFYDFEMGRTTSVTPSDADATVLTASASSSAVAGKYSVEVSQLALADRDSSAIQTGYDVPLGYTGDFWLGGTGTASVSLTPDSTVTGAAESEVLNNWTELGTSTYEVEVAEFDGVMKFRLKDIDGNKVAINNLTSGDDSLTTSWQEISGGTIDTGRGLSITFSDTPVSGSTSVDYTAAGTSVSVEESDTLVDIASKINNADQTYGREIEATIVNNQLILSAANTGINHTMIYTDGVGLGFSDLQTARDASFTVNNISVTRSSNDNLTNVISGVTLNLASDSEGKSAVIDVAMNEDPATEALQAFIDNFNEVQDFVKDKTSVTKETDEDNKTTYSRGALAGDMVFNDLRSDLFTSFLSSQENDGAFSNLRDIGITINDSLQATITDSEALTEALAKDFDSVVSLLDSVMSELDTIISRFTGSETSDGYLENALDSFNDQLDDINTEIEEENDWLLEREEYYITQYAEIQAQMLSLTYMQQQWSSLYGSTNSYY